MSRDFAGKRRVGTTGGAECGVLRNMVACCGGMCMGAVCLAPAAYTKITGLPIGMQKALAMAIVPLLMLAAALCASPTSSQKRTSSLDDARHAGT